MAEEERTRPGQSYKRNAYDSLIWGLRALFQNMRMAAAIVALPACAIAGAEIAIPPLIGGADPGELQDLVIRLGTVAVECFAFALIATHWVSYLQHGTRPQVASIWAPITQIVAALYFLLRIVLMFAFTFSSELVFATGLADVMPLLLIIVPVLLPLLLITSALRFMVLLPPAAVGHLDHGFGAAFQATRGLSGVLLISTIILFMPFLMFRLLTATSADATPLSLDWRILRAILDSFLLSLLQCAWLAMLTHMAWRLELLKRPESHKPDASA